MLELFYKENYPILYGYLLSLCGDPLWAEEIAAETFSRAIGQLHRYNPKYKPSTWLCTIGRNLLYNEYRRRKKFAVLEEAAWDSFSGCGCKECLSGRLGLPWAEVKTGPELHTTASNTKSEQKWRENDEL